MADYKLAPLAEGEKRVSVFQEKAPYSPLAETARAFGQGLTFGTLDEIEAALRTGAISGVEYEKQRNMLREQQKQFGEDVPYVKTPVEIAGGMAVPFGMLGKGVKALAPEAQALVTGKTLTGQGLRGAAVGATTGALSGAGYAEKDAGEAAGLGAIIGAGLGEIGRAHV